MADEHRDLSELANAAADTLNRDDIEAFLELMDPDVEFRSLIAEADGDTYRGHEGVRRWWQSVRSAFQTVEWDFREIDVGATGTRGVAKIQISGTMSGVDVRQTMWQAVETRGGKAVWWRFFRDEKEAREVAGLPA
jgi:ketosteroid isomerase-like protein